MVVLTTKSEKVSGRFAMGLNAALNNFLRKRGHNIGVGRNWIQVDYPGQYRLSVSTEGLPTAMVEDIELAVTIFQDGFNAK